PLGKRQPALHDTPQCEGTEHHAAFDARGGVRDHEGGGDDTRQPEQCSDTPDRRVGDEGDGHHGNQGEGDRGARREGAVPYPADDVRSGQHEQRYEDDVRREQWELVVEGVGPAVLLAAAATAEGVKQGNTLRDADEIVFQTTLHEMQVGRGYYPAMRAALVAKEHHPPTQVRAIRPPTLFLLLRPFPARSWRYV